MKEKRILSSVKSNNGKFRKQGTRVEEREFNRKMNKELLKGLKIQNKH